MRIFYRHASFLRAGGFMRPNKSFGTKVEAARKLVTPKMSRSELAKRLTSAGVVVSAADVTEIEAGKRMLNYYELTVLASVLNTTTHHLYNPT
jgi:hypothetical protein